MIPQAKRKEYIVFHGIVRRNRDFIKGIQSLWLGLSAVVFCSSLVVAQPMVVDDFNDGILDGWKIEDVTTLLGQPWGPGTVGINGKGELSVASSRPIPTRTVGAGNMTLTWDAGADPIYSNGTFQARLRIEEDMAQTGLGMRASGSLATGFNVYLFDVERQEGNESQYCIRRIENQHTTALECVDRENLAGQELWWQGTIVGDQLAFKWWPVDAPEPAEPQLTWVDGALESGTLGLFAHA